MKTYIVTVPQRVVQTYLVDAESAVEARALVNARDSSIEGIENEVVWSGRAARVWLDRSSRGVDEVAVGGAECQP